MARRPSKRETIQALAAEIGVARTTLHAWAAEGCPVREGLSAIFNWHRREKKVTHLNAKIYDRDSRPDPSHLPLWRAVSATLAAIDALQADDEGRESLDAYLKTVVYTIWLRLPAGRQFAGSDDGDQALAAFEAWFTCPTDPLAP